MATVREKSVSFYSHAMARKYSVPENNFTKFRGSEKNKRSNKPVKIQRVLNKTPNQDFPMKMILRKILLGVA